MGLYRFDRQTCGVRGDRKTSAERCFAEQRRHLWHKTIVKQDAHHKFCGPKVYGNQR